MHTKIYWVWLALFLVACQSPTSVAEVVAPTTAVSTPETAVLTPFPTTTLPPTHTAIPSPPPPPSPTPPPTHTHTPLPSITPTPLPTDTATPTPFPTPDPCANRMPNDADLLTMVTLDYGISRNYRPADIVPLSNYFGADVTLGYPSEIRQVIAEPLVQLITDMQTAGLKPQIISGFRDYYAQSLAYQKWLELNPNSATIVSAPPGHSEHQLGTVVDFGSPELPGIVGQPDIQFHTYFYQTSEGLWLAENAHTYGFTLSYTREAFEITGFYYEPWHYRYVGVEMAAQLRDMDMTLTEYQLLTFPPPCVVDGG